MFYGSRIASAALSVKPDIGYVHTLWQGPYPKYLSGRSSPHSHFAFCNTHIPASTPAATSSTVAA